MSQATSAAPAGLAEVASLVHECWLRSPGAPDRPLPVVTLLGRPGSGKTFTLEHLESVTRGTPVARIDFAEAADQRPHEVALHLAFLLSRRHPGIRPLRFPRLLIGLLAVQPELSLTDRRQAVRELRRALRRARSGSAAETGESIAGLIDVLGLSPVPGIDKIVGILLRGFEHMPASAFLNRALASYESSGGVAGNDAIEELVELNRRSRNGTPSDREYVDRRLCGAFLDDARAGFTRGRHEQNCLVLLDNIDHGHGGTEFLKVLLRLRTEAARSRTFDPLLIVATSATAQAIPGPCDGGPDDQHLEAAGEARHSRWLARAGEPPSEWWYPVRLRDFDQVEVSLEAARYETQNARRTGRTETGLLSHSTPLVHRLTYGHPWSVRQLHAAIARLAERHPDSHDLRGLLDASADGTDDSDGPGPDAAENGESRQQLPFLVHDYLLDGLTDDQRLAAMRIAAARTPKAAVNCGLLSDQPEHARDTVIRELRQRLWLTRPIPEDAHTRGGRGPSGYLRPSAGGTDAAADTTFDGRPVLHPWLRLLLLDRMSGPPGSLEDWQSTHRTLRDWHRRHEQPLDTLYHRLALDELDTVVEYFAAGLAAADLRPWLRELYHVTAAPLYRSQLSDDSPHHEARELALRHAPRAFAERTTGRPLAELCAALWLAGDPRNRLPPGAPELNFKIGTMFRQLAMAADSDADTLLDEAARYAD